MPTVPGQYRPEGQEPHLCSQHSRAKWAGIDDKQVSLRYDGYDAIQAYGNSSQQDGLSR